MLSEMAFAVVEITPVAPSKTANSNANFFLISFLINFGLDRRLAVCLLELTPQHCGSYALRQQQIIEWRCRVRFCGAAAAFESARRTNAKRTSSRSNPTQLPKLSRLLIIGEVLVLALAFSSLRPVAACVAAVVIAAAVTSVVATAAAATAAAATAVVATAVVATAVVVTSAAVAAAVTAVAVT